MCYVALIMSEEIYLDRDFAETPLIVTNNALRLFSNLSPLEMGFKYYHTRLHTQHASELFALNSFY